jgi:O-6-methylguanine DNA methyltransferase
VYLAAVHSSTPSTPTLSALDWLESPVGPLIVGASAGAVCLLHFADEDVLESRLESLRRRHAATLVNAKSPVLDRLRKELGEYFLGQRREFTGELLCPGTQFQERVWHALREIPYGETWSYKDLAVRVGDVLATRAVGAANGENPIAIVIPCHRVVNANGELGGYGGGLWRKRILLDLEKGQGRLDF